MIEAIKKYADPNYTIRKSCIGNGNLSHTERTANWSVTTDIPQYKVVTKESHGKEVPSDLTRLIAAASDWGDYEDRLDERKGIELIRQERILQCSETEFQLIDTPGLNDTELRDKAHLSRIHDAIAAVGSIHLVLIVISTEPLTQELQQALKTYANTFPDL